MRALLIFYLMQHFLFSDERSYLIYGAYSAMVYMTPVLGGLISDRFLGARKGVTLGAVLLVLGHFGMALEGPAAQPQSIGGSTVAAPDEASLRLFFLSLALIATGVGFLKTNTTALVGTLYANNDPRRDAGYMLFFMIYNIGAAIAPLLCGWIGHTYGWRFGFGIAGVGMLAGLLVFLRGQRQLLGHAEPPNPEWLNESVLPGIRRETLVYAGSVALVAIVWLILCYQQAIGPMLGLFGCVTAILILYQAFARSSAVERDRLLVCSALIVFTIGFFAFYEQIGSSLNVFADRMVDRRVMGYEVPAPMLQSLPAIFVIMGAPLASGLWLALARRNRDPSAAVKFSVAIALLALAFLVIPLGASIAAAGKQIPLGWLVLCFGLLSAGELCLAPVALAMVTKLAPPRMAGLMTGTFFLAYAASSFISAVIAQRTGQTLGGNLLSQAVAMQKYISVYTRLGVFALAVAILLALLSPLLTRRMHITS
jgi:POT family proton-dependent oligopeptide transporter